MSEAEIHQVVAHWRRQAPETNYIEGVEGSADSGPAIIPGGSSGDDDDDDLMMQAMAIVVETQLGSTSMLQKKAKSGICSSWAFNGSFRTKGRSRAFNWFESTRCPDDSRRARCFAYGPVAAACPVLALVSFHE